MAFAVDERDRAVLDVRQDRVLLRLVEAVDFVDEQDCSSAGVAAALTRFLDHSAEGSATAADTAGQRF
ncbi:MAG: hypothetical protein U0531_20925 [Dehalococcoidia bacterium]